MEPVETLSNEHGLIRQFLDNLTMAAHHIENGRRPSTAFFDKTLDFATQREKHGGDLFERSHRMLVEMGSILTHLH
jgi:hemerythrin-like domain-containing protein